MHQVLPLLLKQNQSLQNSTRSLHQIRTLKRAILGIQVPPHAGPSFLEQPHSQSLSYTQCTNTKQRLPPTQIRRKRLRVPMVLP